MGHVPKRAPAWGSPESGLVKLPRKPRENKGGNTSVYSHQGWSPKGSLGTGQENFREDRPSREPPTTPQNSPRERGSMSHLLGAENSKSPCQMVTTVSFLHLSLLIYPYPILTLMGSKTATSGGGGGG